MFAVIIFLLITLYLACKVYKDKKYFSKEWEKEFGESEHLEPDPEEKNKDPSKHKPANRDSDALYGTDVT